MSLTSRIGLGILLTGLATLLSIGWFLDKSMQDNLMAEHIDMLADHLSMLRREAAKDGPDLHEAREVVMEHLGASNNEKTFGRLVDAKSLVLAETPGFADYSPSMETYPHPSASTQTVPEFTSSGAPGHGGLVYLHAASISRPSPHPELTYYMVNDASQEQRMIHRFRLQLIAAIIAGSVICALLGWLVTRSGLRPLDNITSEIETTTAEALQNPDGQPPNDRAWPRELSRLAHAFDALRSRLSRSFNQLRQFSDDVAHELRNPLHNMMALASLTLQRDRTPEEYQAALASTLEECDRLRRLADGLLFISRADHRRSVLQLTTFDAAQAIREITDYNSELAQDQGITIDINSQGQLTADRSLFRQALTNVISNALRHTHTGGSISINFTPASSENSAAQLTITDTGEGIAPEHLPHIFDRFYRVDTARTHHTDAPPQTGLGLAIVKSIMELHSGTVTTTSTLGMGTTLTLTWPQAMPR
jgi:two-component system heavy metal sensor histidine kinase CusS